MFGLAGSAMGAAKGMGGGPMGAIIGGGLGAAAGALDARQAKKGAEDPNRPKRRRLTRALEEKDKVKRNRERAMAALSQAVMDWSAAIR